VRGTRYPHKKQDFTKQRKTCEQTKQDGLVATHSTPPATWERERRDRGNTTLKTRKMTEKKKRKTQKNPKNHRKGKGDSVKTTQERIPSRLTETVKYTTNY